MNGLRNAVATNLPLAALLVSLVLFVLMALFGFDSSSAPAVPTSPPIPSRS